MSTYRLGKPQIKRLINGQYVTDGSGRKFYANSEVKDNLKFLDEHDLYNKYDVFVTNGEMEFKRKG